MQVDVKSTKELQSESCIDLLLRQEEEKFPEELQAFQTEFVKKKDESGVRVLRYAAADQIKQLVVLTTPQNASIYDLQKSFNPLLAELKALDKQDFLALAGTSYTDGELLQIVRSLCLLDNAFDQHISTGYKNILEKEDSEEAKKDYSLKLYLESEKAAELGHEGETLALATAKARELVNQPANIMTPEQLATEAQKLGETYGFEVEVLGPDKIQELGMEAYWSVAKGSDLEPRFIIMRYKNNPQSQKTLALVGKGLTYDSGGYCIKSAEGMRTMNSDMGGSAAVIAAMAALAREKAEVNVVALVAACENMISGHAFHNGDIIGSMAGKTIEIMSTDAEGRLTLADAVCYAWKHEKADAIVDIATLTGAVVVGLGSHVTGTITDCDELWEKMVKASAACGDKIWRLPIDDDYEKMNESPRADIRNGGKRGGGSITAGLFVRAFANKTPFIHLDIAGTSYDERGNERNPKGASGVGAELLYYFSKSFFS